MAATDGAVRAPGRAGRPIRAQVVGVLVVLTVLWGYASFLTCRDAADLLAVRTLGERLGQPTDALILGLQAERRLTAIELAAPGRHRAALAEQRVRTDSSAGMLRRFARTPPRLITPESVRTRAAELVDRLATLETLRSDVDGGRLGRATAVESYGRIIDAGFAVYGSQWVSRRTDLIEETRALVALSRAGELLAREDALVAGALAAARLTDAEHARLVDLVALWRFAVAEAAAGLPAAQRAGYDRLAAGAGFADLHAMEALLTQRGRGTGPPTTRPAQWQAAVEPVLSELRGLVTAGVRSSVDRATPGAAIIVARTGLVGGLGLVLVLAAIMLSVRSGRQLAGHLDRLADERTELMAARDTLTAKLTAQTERLAAQTTTLTEQRHRLEAHRARSAARPTQPARPAGLTQPARPAGLTQPTGPTRPVRPGQSTPPVRPGQSTPPVRPARVEADERARDVFATLTRQSQSLLHRQLGLLDAMERRTTDTEELAELFRVDHLATRIRRNVEQLISLSGGVPGRRWRHPIPLVDVLRGAMAEVSDYPRVLVSSSCPGAIAGPALPDLIHLLAALVEHALSHSPPTSTVRISVEPGEGGRTIVVTDDGQRRGPAAMAAANELIRNPATTGQVDDPANLYVAGMLGRRHGIVVELVAAARGGTAARVLVPAGLVVEARDTGWATSPAGATAGTTAGGGSPALPVRVRKDHPVRRVQPETEGRERDQPSPGTRVDPVRQEGGAQPNHAPVRRAERDCSATMELPVTLPAPTDDPLNSSERTTGGSRSGHDR